MNKILKIFAVCGIALSLASCNKMTPEQMAAGANQIKIECLPELLTLTCGKVPVELDVTFPKGFFYPEVVMVVTPVLVYEGGETPSIPIVYQGENVKDNDKTVSRKGAVMTERFSFDYAEPMHRSYLELRAELKFNGKTLAMPARKVADGIVTVEQLAELGGRCSFKKDDYQAVLKKTAEGQIKYTVNSSKVSGNQLRSESIEDYQDKMDGIKNNDRYTVTGTQIVSYASPEGGKEYNAKLSDKRSDAARKAWKVVGKGMQADSLEIKSIGQDWEGFKEAVEKSNIPDKDLILRVLSMYSNPAVRESEIKNLSQIYREIKAEVFPELRRSRFITNLDYRNYSEDELADLADKKLYMLDEEGLLRLASVAETPERAEFLYNFAFEKFGSKRAGYNLAVLAYRNGRPGAVDFYLDKVADEDDPAVINMRGLAEMSRKGWYKSEDLFEKAATEESTANIGVVNMLQGKYDKAVSVLPDGDVNKVVSALLCGKTDAAAAAIKGDDARADYLRAIVAARKGNKADVLKYSLSAARKDPAYGERAAKEVEFAKYL